MLSLIWQAAGQVRRVPVQWPLRIGRDRSCDIVLSDAQASRQHCVVTPRPDGLLVDASASTNGVVGPNGQTRTLFVPPNGAFVIGHTRFEVRLATPAEVAGIGQQRAGTSHGGAMPGMTVGADQPMPYVTYQQAGQPRRVAVDRTLRIGRHPSMDIVVNDPQVSREHCTVTPRADGLAVDATGSANGVVGPHGQAPALVAPPGGWFVVGGTRFEVGVGTAGELARHTLPPSQRRGGRSRRRGPVPVLFAALGGLAVVAVVVVGIVALGSRNETAAGGTSEPPETFAFTDAKSTLQVLGGDASDSHAVSQVQDIINKMPAGTQAVRTGDSQTKEQDDLRVVTTPYELRVPGQAPKPFTLETDYGRDGSDWVQIATYVADAS